MSLAAGSGTVKFGFDTIRTYPEWFGAVANGVNDDSKAVQVGLAGCWRS
jgi:hypothetical protein